MTTNTTNARRLEEGGVQEEVPEARLAPQGVQFPQDAQLPPQGDYVLLGGEVHEVLVVPLFMANGEIRQALIGLAQAMTTHVNRDIGPRMNALESTMTSRLMEFVRMNPPIFLGF